MSYLNLHLQEKIRHKLQEATEILNEYHQLKRGAVRIDDVERISSVGSQQSSNAKREQATSVSFINIPHKKTAATSTTSPPVTRSRAASHVNVPTPSGNFPQLDLDSNDEYQAAKLKDRARSVTEALQDLIDVAEKSDNQSDKSEYTQIIKEPTPEKRKRRTRLTRSNLDIVVSSITSVFVSFFRWLQNNKLFKRFLESMWFDLTMFVIMLLLIVRFVPCNKIPGLQFTNPYAQY